MIIKFQKCINLDGLQKKFITQFKYNFKFQNLTEHKEEVYKKKYYFIKTNIIEMI